MFVPGVNREIATNKRVPLVGHPAARAKRSAQQLHGRQAAERTVHVIEHQPSEGPELRLVESHQLTTHRGFTSASCRRANSTSGVSGSDP